MYRKKKLVWGNSLTRMFNLTLQYCTLELEDKLKITTGYNYNDMYLVIDAIVLLGLIRDVAHYHTDDKNKVMVWVESDLVLYTCAQGPKQTNSDYAKHFRAQVKTVMAHEGQPWSHPALIRLIKADVHLSLIHI